MSAAKKRREEKLLFATSKEKFVSSKRGIFRVVEDERTRVCGWLSLSAMVKNLEIDTIEYEVSFDAIDGCRRRISVPAAEFQEFRRLRERLLNGGLHVDDERVLKAFLLGLQAHCRPTRWKFVTSRPGWQEVGDQKVFVTGAWTEPSGNETRDIHFSGQAGRVSEAGTLREWNDRIGALCVGNSRLILAVCASLAPPALHLTGVQSFGYCLVGPTTKGKTTTLTVAASVWGHPDQFAETWNATRNAIDRLAAQHSDLPLILDDMAQANAADISHVVYGVANGTSRRRLPDVDRKTSVRVIFAASSEIPVRELLRRSAIEPLPGEAVRLLSVPLPAGGAFSQLHGAETPAAVAVALTAQAKSTFGALGRRWVRELAKRPDKNAKYLRQAMEKFQASVLHGLPVGLDTNIATRAAQNFSLLAAVGECAIKRGLLKWEKGEARLAIEKCYSSWSKAEAAEQAQAADPLLEVRRFFQSNSDGHFEPFERYNDADHRHNLAGYTHRLKGDPVFLALPAWFEVTFCKRTSAKLLLAALRDRGYLVTGEGGRTRKQVRVPKGKQRPQFYVIRRTIIDA